MTIIFFGDIVGKIGREAIKKVLPELNKKFKPDLIMANVENLAHGKGVTEKTLDEMVEAGINIFTSGNHITKKGEFGKILSDEKYQLVRPANYPPTVVGREYLKLKIKNKNVFILNFLGRVFFRETVDCPFRKFDEIYNLLKIKKNDIVLIDFHAEATSEKRAFGWYVDGRASALFGTHTHIETADEKILPLGTGYITDVGMTGGLETVIGVKKDNIIEGFLSQTTVLHEFPETGPVEVNALLIKIDDQSGKCWELKRIHKEIKI
ncbi:MAG TPA: TIGR00282 family metallophosphoesterase [bacterium]|nr:TIGR00282 family metallophosphoesterase [bacterium]